MNTLSTAKHFSRAIVTFGLLATATSCTEEKDPTASLSAAQFTQSTLAITENAGEQVISLWLDVPAPSNGHIVIKAKAIVPSCYSTLPVSELGQVTLPIEAGQTTVSFKMTPTDNGNLDGTRLVKFSILTVTAGLRVGPYRELLISVNDDEGPVAANFETFSLNVRENTDVAGKINIVLAGAAPAEGVIVMKLQSTSGYGTGYATAPAAVGDKIFVTVPKGATSATVNVYPVNDQSFKPDRNINLRIIDATGGVSIGAGNEFWCAITEDDGHQITTISSVRETYAGESIILHGNNYIEGIVTSINNMPGGRVVVEDATGALPLQINTAQSLTRGDLVLVNLNNGLLRDSKGMLEVTQISEFEKLGVETVRVNKITLQDLIRSGDRMESQTVQLTGVSFTGADGAITFRGDNLVSDGQNTIIVRTTDGANFANEIVPEGLVNVTGIFTDLGDGVYVLYPQTRQDINKQQFMIRRD
jgi:hypothetical protein